MSAVRWQHRLGVRILAGVVAALAIGYGLMFYTLHQWQNQEILNQAQQQSESIAHTMMASLKTLMLAGDAESVRDWLARLRAHPELKSVEVVRRNGIIAFRDLATMHQVNHFLGNTVFSRKGLNSRSVQGITATDIRRAASGETVIEHDPQHQQLTLLLPIHIEKPCLACHGYEHNPIRGVLRITTSTADATAKIKRNERRLLSLAIIGILVLATIIFLLLRASVLNPIARLHHATSKIASGRTGVQVAVTGHDEVSELMEAFNSMSAQMEQSMMSCDDMEAIVHSLGEMLFVTNAQGTIHMSNQRGCDTLGYNAKQMLGRTMASLLASDQPAMDFSQPRQGEEINLCTHHGKQIPAALSSELIPPRFEDDPPQFVHVLRDLTQQRESERELRLAATVMDTVPSAIMVADSNSNIRLLNPAFSEITGYTIEEAMGKNPRILNSGRQSKAFYAKMWAQILETGRWSGEIWNKRKNGEIYPEFLIINTMRDKSGAISYYVSTFLDISEQKKLEDKLRYNANHDTLTGLPNRALLADRLTQSLTRARRVTSQVGVLFIDIDGFKLVNDNLGHDAGDALLQQISERLCNCVRESDTVARVGGDEFVIILESAEEKTAILAVAEKIITVMQQPFTLPAGECHIGASIGISIFPDLGDEEETLLKQADTAMYVAKDGGKNRAVMFDAT
ncbi:MAG: diguanylate cyclase [Mariprofundales bacterium]|nr:diguanylate cyclase [Mariprofundales bacterium]